MEINLGKVGEFTIRVPEGKPGGSDPPAISMKLEPDLEASLELLEALGRGDKFEVVLRQYQAGMGKPPELPLPPLTRADEIIPRQGRGFGSPRAKSPA
mgnify:FL=1